MKNIFKILKKSLAVNTTPRQKELLDFVKDRDTLKRAAEGSMSKRNALLDRVEAAR